MQDIIVTFKVSRHIPVLKMQYLMESLGLWEYCDGEPCVKYEATPQSDEWPAQSGHVDEKLYGYFINDLARTS